MQLKIVNFKLHGTVSNCSIGSDVQLSRNVCNISVIPMTLDIPKGELPGSV